MIGRHSDVYHTDLALTWTRHQGLSLSLSLTHALTLIVLVDEDVVQDKVEQLVLQGTVGVKDQRLEALPAA